MAEQLICESCKYPLRLVGPGGDDTWYVIDLEHDPVDRIRPEMWGLPRLNGVVGCPANRSGTGRPLNHVIAAGGDAS